MIQCESQMNWHKHIERKLNIIIMIKKEWTQKLGLRKEWKVTGVVYKKGEPTENRKTERVQIKLKGSMEKNRKRTPKQ